MSWFRLSDNLSGIGRNRIKTWATTVLLFLFAVPAGQAADNMKAFPPAEIGLVSNFRVDDYDKRGKRFVCCLGGYCNESSPGRYQVRLLW